MPKNVLRPLAAAALAALLLLAPLTAVAAPAKDSGSFALPWDGWAQWLARWWPTTDTGSQETFPWVDPNGAAPPHAGGSGPASSHGTSEVPGTDAEALPWVDPDGAQPPPGDGPVFPSDTTTSGEPGTDTETLPWVDPNG